MTGMEGTALHTTLRCTREYLTAGIGPLIKPAGMEN